MDESIEITLTPSAADAWQEAHDMLCVNTSDCSVHVNPYAVSIVETDGTVEA